MTESTPTTAAFALTAEQATDRLGAMTTAYRAAQTPGLPSDPAATLTSAQAAMKLERLQADEEWGRKLLAGDGPTVREFHELNAAKIGNNQVEHAIAGTLEIAPFEYTRDGELPKRALLDSVANLREIGLRDEVIRDALNGNPVSAMEKQLAVVWEQDHFGDPEWVRNYLSGNPKHRREAALLAIIKTAPTKN